MKLLIELNPTEATNSIVSGTLLALLEAFKSEETQLKTTYTEAKTQKAIKVSPELLTTIAPASPITIVTIEEVREKLAQLTKAGKQEQVRTLLAKHGASKLTDIPADKYPMLLEEAQTIK